MNAFEQVSRLAEAFPARFRMRSGVIQAIEYPSTKFIKASVYSLSLQSYTMKMRFHYRTITGYRTLPPRRRIVEEEKDYRSPTDRYLSQVDKALQEAKPQMPYQGENDIASLVFLNQLMEPEVNSRQSAYLIQERRSMTERHLKDVQWRLDEMLERKPLRLRGPGFHDDKSLTEVERQILNLEMQKRALELALWRDTHELRTNLMKERTERETTRHRIGYLAGGGDGGV